MNINIAVWWVLDYETGSRETLGGLERWTRDIVVELVSRGHEVSVYQKSAISYQKAYHGARIYGIPCSKNFSGNISFYRAFKTACKSEELAIFISQDLLWGDYFKNAIAVNHGVWWSSRQSRLKRFALELFNGYYLRRAKRTICVDTNYINWVIESVDGSHELLHKIAHVPNYFDPDLFQAKWKLRSNRQELKILFPRRIMGTSIYSEPRGGEDAIRALAVIRGRGVAASLTMLGEGNLSDDLKTLAADLAVAQSVTFATAHFDEMPSFYDSHDVVLVPSRFSEGTSLSAIEGLAAGCFVIGSCVGGLQNLPLFPPFGDMVVPNAEALANALCGYVRRNAVEREETDGTLRNQLMARLSIDNWKKAILGIIKDVADEGGFRGD
jgi:glycosyltransferase involved in cell wall biosynthesis